MDWKIVEGDDYCFEVVDPSGWYKAFVKWDGCFEFYRAFNIPFPETNKHPQLIDQIHICDINELIEQLQALKIVAKQYFAGTGKDYEYWEDS